MKKIICLIVCVFSFLFVSPVFSQDFSQNMPQNGSRVQSTQGIPTDNNDSDTQDSDDFYNEMIYEDYGSNQSPAFNNREDINPNESNYGFGSSGGDY
jgi:hypothetical protein